MRVLLCHAYYAERGGEDISFELERDLLSSAGLDVSVHTWQNVDWSTAGRPRQVADALWNRRIAMEVSAAIDQHAPDVLAVNNHFPFVSPAVVRRRPVAVVKSLRNYRLSCVNGMLYRNGRACTDCVGRRIALPGVVHGCYRSPLESSVVATTTALHRAVGTWRNHVDQFLVLTEFMAKTLADVLPGDRVTVRPNTLAPEPEPGPGSAGTVVYVGRLQWEKGPLLLLDAWERLGAAAPRLVMIGDGPQATEVASRAHRHPRVSWLGAQPHEEVLRRLRDACVTVVPSVVYEGFPRAVVESLACGTPVVAPDHGSTREIVDGTIGARFTPGDAGSLAAAVVDEVAASAGPSRRAAARSAFDARYSNRAWTAVTLAAYERAVDASRIRRSRARRKQL